MENHRPVRPPSLRRAWLFVPGADAQAHFTALQSDADAIVADLEEMTSQHERPAARERIVTLLKSAHAEGRFGAVRINKLEHDGHADLEGIMPGAPHAVFLPHTESAAQLVALDTALSAMEKRLGIRERSTEIVPTIESAKGLVNLDKLLGASRRIRCCMLAVEDLVANLGARRTPRGDELLYARSRFLIECIGANVVPIDLPCTYRCADLLSNELQVSTQLGFTAKCVVFAAHVKAVNCALTPSASEATAARALVDAHRAQQAGNAATSQDWIDYPERNNALRSISRHEALSEFYELAQVSVKDAKTEG